MRFTYVEGGEVIVDVQDILDGAGHGADDPVDHMHHAVCGHLVTVDDSGTVHCHNLNKGGGGGGGLMLSQVSKWG